MRHHGDPNGDPAKRRALETTRSFIAITMITLLLSWSYRIKAEASPGDLDPNFGTGGKVITEFIGPGMSVEAFGFAIQPDGKIVVQVVAGTSSWPATIPMGVWTSLLAPVVRSLLT